MTDTTASTIDSKPESRAFEADVARLLHLMVHSVYSDKDVFLRELISNAADACERLRYDAIATPALLADDPKARITITLDPDKREARHRGQRHRHEPRRDWSRRSAPSRAPAPRRSWNGSRPARPARAPR